MIPDYLVNIKTADDCAKNWWVVRDWLMFFPVEPSSSGFWETIQHLNLTVNQNNLTITQEDKLLMEECHKLGLFLTSAELSNWKNEAEVRCRIRT